MDEGFPSGSDGKESACSAGDLGLVQGSGRRSPGEGNGYPFQYSCLGNPRDRATVHGVPKSWTQLSNYHSEWMGLWDPPGFCSGSEDKSVFSDMNSWKNANQVSCPCHSALLPNTARLHLKEVKSSISLLESSNSHPASGSGIRLEIQKTHNGCFLNEYMNAWISENSQSLLPRHWPPNSGDTESLLTPAAEIIRNLHTSMWSTCMDTESLCLYTYRCEYGTRVSWCPVWPMPSTWFLNIHTYVHGHHRHTAVGAGLEWSESCKSSVGFCLYLKYCYFVHHGFFFFLHWFWFS